MGYGVGASGFVGFAAEVTPGTWVTPTVFPLLLNANMQFMQKQIQRRPLRGIADLSGMLPGDTYVAGPIKFEVTSDVLPFILRFARGTIVKTDTAGIAPYTYVYTPSAIAVPTKTASITIVRNGVVFGYTGNVVSSMAFAIEDGILTCEMQFVGMNEAVQSLPTATYTTAIPPSTGLFDLEFAGVDNNEADTFTLTINDNAEPQFRLQGGNLRGAVFVKYGERTTELSINRDFQTRTDFDAFKAMTAQAVDLKCVRTAASDEINFNVPTAIKSAYEIQGLAGQADLIRANISYVGVYDTVTSRPFQITCKSSTSVTIP